MQIRVNRTAGLHEVRDYTVMLRGHKPLQEEISQICPFGSHWTKVNLRD